MKNIRDSVHGNIVVKDEYITTILDTPAFQRLRRIEQTAIRSIFPSARHDRFIHSLGVYHIGWLIVQHLEGEFKKEILKEGGDGKFFGFTKEQIKCVINSYLVACLLHDIAHAPFSHTFEKYFGAKEELFGMLNKELKDSLTDDMSDPRLPNFHEYASAIVVCKEYRSVIENELCADLELVCRMIIGCFYKREKTKYELYNCFISLLHGDVVDADRMDYACRDVWASGYCTSSIDVNRIVKAIHIRKDSQKHELNVCFDCNALNEIRNMLDVRQFQNKYVINHHSVQYEQALMVRAAEQAAKQKKGMENGTEALQKIIHVDACHSGNYISDEDLLLLMKDDSNPYFKEYSSRQYTRFAVWKTPDEFFHYFPQVPRGKDLTCVNFEDEVKKVLSEIVNPDDVIICKVSYRQPINLKSLYVVVNDAMVRYTDIHPELQVDLGGREEDIGFYYIYVPKYGVENLTEQRKKIVELLDPVFSELYPQANEEHVIYDFIQTALEKAFGILYKGNDEQIKEKKNQIKNMGRNVDRLADFIKESGLENFIAKFPIERT